MIQIGRTLSASRPPDILDRPIAALIALGQQLRRLYAAWRARSELTRLSELDDRMLKDIGIQRADIDWASMQPWDTDPTKMLAQRVQRRRASELWVRRLVRDASARPVARDLESAGARRI